MKSIRYLTPNIAKIYRDSLSTNNVVLIPDELKTFKRYSQLQDINGEFFVRIDEGDNGNYEADYCKVKFFFPYDNAVNSGNFYTVGKFCDWKMNKENRMSYNATKKGYECELYLKQGYYNYKYVFAEDGKIAADESIVEGTHWETENDYTIYVYHRGLGTYYDRLVGITKMNSIRK